MAHLHLAAEAIFDRAHELAPNESPEAKGHANSNQAEAQKRNEENRPVASMPDYTSVPEPDGRGPEGTPSQRLI